MNNAEFAALLEEHRGWSEEERGDTLPPSLFAAMLRRLRGEPEAEWIAMEDKSPRYGDGELLEFKSEIGTWTEYFELRRGWGKATHWRKL